MNARAEDITLPETTDDAITTIDPSRLVEGEPDATSRGPEKGDQSAGSSETDGQTSNDTGGAGTEEKPDGEEAEGADSTSAERTDTTGNDAKTAKAEGQTVVDDQSTSAAPKVKAESEASPKEIDHRAEYLKLMAPFKAAKRDITIDNVEDARRLMQMGVDYARKMEEMKPYRRVLKTLENAGLLDIDKLNFVIDLQKKSPAAIKKFLKDSEIDPIDLNLEEGGDYKPTDHAPSDAELALDDVLNEIRGTPSFERTIEVVTKEWDRASQKLLMDNPGILRHMNLHVQTGLYDQIINKVVRERTLGRLPGMSDLEAYKAVGDAMLENGELIEPNSSTSSTAGKTPQGGSHPNGSDADLKARKKAASPTKGSASTPKKTIDFGKMTDDQISKFDINSL